MKYMYIVLLFVIIVNSVNSFLNYGSFEDYEYYYDNSGQHHGIPKKISQPKDFEVVLGDSVILPCETNVSDYLRAWKRAGLWSQSNVKLLRNGSLEVKIMSQNDTGDYICELWIKHEMYKIAHKVALKIDTNITTYEATSPVLTNDSHLHPTNEQSYLKINALLAERRFTQINSKEVSSDDEIPTPIQLPKSNGVSTAAEQIVVDDVARISSHQKLDKNSNLSVALHSLIYSKQKNRLYNQKQLGRTYFSTSAERSFGVSSYPKISLYSIGKVSVYIVYIVSYLK